MTSSIIQKSARLVVGYSHLYGATSNLSDLVELIKKYPLYQWLNFLSRIQLVISGEKFKEVESQKEVFERIFSNKAKQNVVEWVNKNPEAAKAGIMFTERQVTVLQELAILHAPEVLDKKAFEGEEDFDVLSKALLIVNDLIYDDEDAQEQNLIAALIHTQATTHVLPLARSFSRAVKFYQLDEVEKSSVLMQYRALFKEATGYEIDEYVLGGMCYAMHEEQRTHEDICNGWYALQKPDKCNNRSEKIIRKAFYSLKTGLISDIRKAVQSLEGDNPREFNLIAVSKYPIVELENGSAYVLNSSSLGRSLYDGPRHIIMSKAIERGNGEPNRVGGIFGEIFQDYVLKLLTEKFNEKIIEISDAEFKGYADCLLLFGNSVVVVEIKSEHFHARNHAKFLTIEERIDQIRETVIGKSVAQIKSTIVDLRNGNLSKALGLPYIDWTITPIIPLVITDENLPMFPLICEKLYTPLEEPLKKLSGGHGPIRRMRILSVEDLEMFQDISVPHDFGQLLQRWGNDEETFDSSFKNYLLAKSFRIGTQSFIADFEHACKLMAARLGLDPESIRASTRP
ncbi:MAG: hypothetical protein R3A13_01415 [Bdellovibrionota bacterium]